MSEALQPAGAIAATLLIGAALVLPARRWRGALLAAALALATALIAGQAWDGPLTELRERPAELALLALAALVVLGGLALGFRRWPWALPLAALAALPIRIPVELGGESSNLLVPLYAVILAGALAASIDSLRGTERRPLALPRPLAAALTAAIVLYAVQAIYSSDVDLATRNVAFFLVPFGALLVLLAEIEWRPKLLLAGLGVISGEALLFSLVGIAQHQLGEIFWNEALEASNDFHFYFRVNSLFWDPNIYGRYLALAGIVLLAALLWVRERPAAGGLAAAVAVIWLGLAFAFSQSSFIALLVGVGVLCALSWSLRWTLVAAPLVLAAVIAGIAVSSSSEGPRSFTDTAGSGRSSLVSGGIGLFGDRPLQGHGSGSFPIAFRERENIPPGLTTNSHNEPVTVAAEQGVVGLLVYGWLLAAALWTLFGGMRRIAPGLGSSRAFARGRAGRPTEPEIAGADDGARVSAVARIAVAAGFCALLIHTFGYAGYLTDPLTWSLLAVGSTLASGARSTNRR